MASPPPSSVPPYMPPLAGLSEWYNTTLSGRTLDELLWLEAQGRYYQQQYVSRGINHPPPWIAERYQAIGTAITALMGA